MTNTGFSRTRSKPAAWQFRLALGEGRTDSAIRFGVQWKSKKCIVAATYSNAFNGSAGAGFEIGLPYLTQRRYCFRGCRK